MPAARLRSTSMTLQLNRAFVLETALSTSFRELVVPELSERDVLIEVKRTGICGSDVHFYTEGRLGDKLITDPIILGHESSGFIVQVGRKVDSDRIGERVAIEPWSTCRICEYCKNGRYQLCAQCSVFDSPRRGTLARYCKVPSDLAYTLPDSLTLEDGALMEPLAVAVHAVLSVDKLRTGQEVAVFGCGAVGLLCMAVARALGAKRIIAMDIDAARLEFATGYASAHAFLPPPSTPEETKMRYSERISNLLKHASGLERGADLCIDATGAETCIQVGLMMTKSGGTFVQVGIGASTAHLPYSLLYARELTVKGSSRYGPGDFQLAIDLASSGKIDLKSLITHRFDFEDSAAAFETTRAGVGDTGRRVLKTMISGPSQ